MDISAIQQALRDLDLPGWLLFDFHGSNPIAVRIAEIPSGAMTTRRWYYWIPASGTPRALVHAIERDNLGHLPGETLIYSRRSELEQGLKHLVHGATRAAMEYSPRGAIPYASRVDAGTVELVRSLGVDVVSSADLVSMFESRWSPDALASHLEASAVLYRAKDEAFAEIGRRLRTGIRTTEYDIQQLMAGLFAAAGMESDAPPVVAAQENSGNPHYLPTAARAREIQRDEIVLLDLWVKRSTPHAVYADITWVGYTGAQPPAECRRAWNAARAGRDAALALVTQAAASGTALRGFEVDVAARRPIEAAGFGDRFIHRTGHSLGEQVHGNGANLDDYETHDDRRLLPASAFTIEPGVYFPEFGVRTEINVYLADREARVSGPMQADIVPLL